MSNRVFHSIAASTASSLVITGVVLLAFTSQSSAAQTAKSVQYPECFCTDKQGKRRELGDIVCLTVGGRSFRAKCVMAQNVPFWRDLSQACIISQAPHPKGKPQSTRLAHIVDLYEKSAQQ